MENKVYGEFSVNPIVQFLSHGVRETEQLPVSAAASSSAFKNKNKI